MEFNTVNFGKLAYEETNEIRRQMYDKPEKHNLNIKTYVKHNVIATDSVLESIEFNSINKALIEVVVNFEISSSSSTNVFKLAVIANNVVLENISYDSSNLKTFSFNYSFFAYEKNLLEFKVLSGGAPVEFKYFEVKMIGHYTVKNLNYSNFLLESSNVNNSIVVFHKKNDVYHKFEFSNINNLVNNFDLKNGSAVMESNLLNCAYNLTYSGGYKNLELFLLKKDEINNKVKVANVSGAMQTIVSDSKNSICCLQGSYWNNISLIYFEFNGVNLTYKTLNNNLNIVNTKTKAINLKNSVKKLVPIFYKNTTEVDNADVLFINNKNEVYLINCYKKSYFSQYEINENPIFIGKGEDAYSVFYNNKLHIFILYNDEIRHLTYQYYANTNNNKKISEKTVYNAQFGYVSNENIPFYFYYKTFGIEQSHD